MTLSLSTHQTRLLRMKAQRLQPAKAAYLTAPELVLREIFAVQAQDLPAALLALRARSAGLTAAQVMQDLRKDHSIVWTWCMRGTMHLVRAQDAGWLIPFLGPMFIAASSRRFQQLGWDEQRAEAGLHLLQKSLADNGELTRPEIARLLEENNLPHEGQATIHLIRRAALEGILCMGADGHGKPTYVLYEDWIERLQPLAPEEALEKIALSYLEAYAPTSPEDLASWSGLKLRAVREAWQLIGDRLVEVEAAGKPAWLLQEQLPWVEELNARSVDPAPFVRLLPDFDTYLLGYASRELVVEDDYARQIHPGGGLIYPVLLVDGRALGTWQAKRSGDKQEVVISLFSRLPKDLLPLIEAEVDDIARFLDREMALIIETPLQA